MLVIKLSPTPPTGTILVATFNMNYKTHKIVCNGKTMYNKPHTTLSITSLLIFAFEYTFLDQL